MELIQTFNMVNVECITYVLQYYTCVSIMHGTYWSLVSWCCSSATSNCKDTPCVHVQGLYIMTMHGTYWSLVSWCCSSATSNCKDTPCVHVQGLYIMTMHGTYWSLVSWCCSSATCNCKGTPRVHVQGLYIMTMHCYTSLSINYIYVVIDKCLICSKCQI